MKKKEFIEFIRMVVSRPAMFMVNNVEDLSLVLFGYSIGCKNQDVFDFLDSFREFVNKEFKSKDNIDWPRLIRFYGASDYTTMQLFSDKFEKFVSQNTHSF